MGRLVRTGVAAVYDWLSAHWLWIALGLGVLGGVSAIVALIKHWTDKPVGQVVRQFWRGHRWFRLAAKCLVGLLVVALSWVVLGRAFCTCASGVQAQRKTRIVVLLPTGDVVRSAYQDGERQLQGLSQFINENDGRYTDDYEFVPINHAMDPVVASGIIARELARGTRYFISTMSRVNEALSRDFERLASVVRGTGPVPILLCTVTSSPTLSVKPDSVYRMYPRSQEEATVLAEHARSEGIKAVLVIAVGDAYGDGMVREFKQHWVDRRILDTVRLKYSDGVQEVRTALTVVLKKAGHDEPDAVMVAHYGHGLSAVVSVLDELRPSAKLFLTSQMSIRDWQVRVFKELRRMDWHTCVPDYEWPDPSKDDVIRDFTTYSLRMLVQALNIMRNNPSLSFDQCWRKSEVYTGLDITWDSVGDSRIPLKVVDKSYFSLFSGQ